MASFRSLVELANSISKDAAILDEHCKSNSLPEPSLDVGKGSLNNLSDPNAVKAQERLITDTHELHKLGLGSFSGLRALQTQPDIDLMTLSFITKYHLAQKVPTQGDISFSSLATKCGIPPAFVKRILRYAMTNFLFAEPRPGYVSHTAMSLLLKERPFLQVVSEIATQERFPGTARVIDAIAASPECDEPSKSGWGIANNAKRPMFEEFAAEHPERAARFGKAMEATAAMVTTDGLIQDYDWESLGKARFVDVGGGKGPVAIDLARKFPDMTFVVQDLPGIVEQARKQLPEDVKDRIEFMEANFFEEQPVKEADVYFLRAVFHNWPDKYCIRILQNLIPALKKSAKVIVHDPSIGSKDTSRWNDRVDLASTLHMMVYFNAHDRDETEWKELFAQADPRFRVASLKMPGTGSGAAGSGLCTLEAIWEG